MPPSRQLATSGYSVVGAVCELDPVHHSPGSDGVQCTTGVITHVQPCMTISKVSSFQRLKIIIHVEGHGNSDAILLADRLASFYLVQHVPVQLTSSAVHSTL